MDGPLMSAKGGSKTTFLAAYMSSYLLNSLSLFIFDLYTFTYIHSITSSRIAVLYTALRWRDIDIFFPKLFHSRCCHGLVENGGSEWP